jgi:glycosyltransferase involved in cell wall biosynthesis
MKLTVIIATYGRKALLDRALTFLEGQSRLPDAVIVSAPDETHVQRRETPAYPLSFVFGGRGLCAQRNKGLEAALGDADVITFFDDDFLPAADYLALVEAAFRDNPDWAVLRGEAVVDGAKGAGLSFEEGLAALRKAETARAIAPVAPQVSDQVGGYGCNMSIRAAFIGAARFDESLPLYGWQEDIDFSGQLRERGRVVGLNTLYGVHLGAKGGRVSGVRLGYSQLVNPVYLVRKGTVPAGFAFRLMWRNIAANTIKSFWPEPYIDRRGRLKGNILAALHLARGKVDPGFILKLKA